MKKNNLLLVNKADMMTLEQRQVWADYFVENDINFRFFSAELAKEMNEAKGLQPEEEFVTQDSGEESNDSEEESTDEAPAPGDGAAPDSTCGLHHFSYC